MTPTPIRDRVVNLNDQIRLATRAASPLELQVALTVAVAGCAGPLAQSNIFAADTVLTQVAEVLGVQT